MKVWKKIGIAALGLVTLISLGACGSSEDATTNDSSNATTSGEVEEKVIGVAAGPYGDMVTDVISPLLEEKGFSLTTQTFNDYIQPNNALAQGSIDGNLFQHTAYLEQFIADNELELTPLQIVPTLGMGIYSNEITSIEDLEDGATVSVPSDASNLSRALKVLEANGIISIDPDTSATQATVDDVTDNPHDLQFTTLDAPQLARSIDTMTIAMVPGNYAWAANLDPGDALILEDLGEDYKNVFVVATDEADSDFAKAVTEVLESQEFKDAIADSDFKDFTKPAFWSDSTTSSSAE